LKQAYRKQNSAHLLAHAHELKVTPFTATINTAWKLLRDYKGDDFSASPQLPSQMRTNISADKRMWTEGDIQREPHIGIKIFLLPLSSFLLFFPPLSPWDESEADRVTQTLNSPHPSDSQIPDPELNKTPTREEVKEMLKHLPSDKAAGPDGITNRILQASGDQAIDMIYLYMLIIWEVQTYPGAWVSALMQPIYKGGGKDRSYRGIYLLNTLTKLFEGLMEARLSKFTEFNDSLTPSQQGSRITRQTHDAIYALVATIQERSQYGSPSYCYFIDFATAYPSVHRERLGLTLQNYKITGKIWHLLKENSRSVRVRVLHALIDQDDEVHILRGLPEGSRLSPTLFGSCVAELILELRAKFPLLQFPQITSIVDLDWSHPLCR